MACSFGLWCPRAGEQRPRCAVSARCQLGPGAGRGLCEPGTRLMRLMSNPRDLSGLPCLAVRNHFVLMPQKEKWDCLVGTSDVLSLSVPFPVHISGMSC